MTSVAEALKGEVEQRYREMTPASARMHERACTVFPDGDTRQTVFLEPYSLFIETGSGAYVTDADGNRFIDCSNCWSAMAIGHAYPGVVEAVTEQAARGSAFAAATRPAVELAELLKERVPSIEQLRFANTGSEAVMLAVRAARAFTGRRKIVKMFGSYHGAHDEYEVSGGGNLMGLIPGVEKNVIEVEFNNKDAVSQVMAEQGDDVAAVVVEGIMGVAGMLPPEDGYLQHLREETERYGALLILDEVISLRLAPGGAQELYDVRPDLTTLGKIIGGGYPIGAFGGREEIMRLFSPLRDEHLHHSGTFNANPISMTAGLAGMGALDADTIAYLNLLGVRFREAARAAAAKAGITVQLTGVGSLCNLHFAAERPSHAAASFAADGTLLRLAHLKLLTDGVLIAPRGMFAFSSVMTEAEVDQIVERVAATLEWLRPAIAERAPELLA